MSTAHEDSAPRSTGTQPLPSQPQALTLIEAITRALAWELEHDPAVLLLGEDIGVNGGSFVQPLGFNSSLVHNGF